jgi:hypothetical protein
MADYEELDLGYVGEGGGNVDTVDDIEPDVNKNIRLRYFVTKAWWSAADRPLPAGRYIVIDGGGDIGPLINQRIAEHNAEETAHLNKLIALETRADDERSEREQNEGDLADLQTQDKSNLTSAINETYVKSLKLLSKSTQRLYSDISLRTYIDETTGEAGAYKLLGTAPDGTEYTLVEMAQDGAGGKAEIGSKAVRLNLNTKGGSGIDNHVTVETEDSDGAAVALPLAYLADVISQCTQALEDAKSYADEKDTALRIDALIVQPPCNESELPQYDPDVLWEQSHNGYWYQIKDFDVTRPGRNIKGTATWYDDLGGGEPGYYLAYDQYRNADGITTKLTEEGAIAVNDITEEDTTADTNPFTALDGVAFLELVKSIVKKINGAFQLTASINTILGQKANKTVYSLDEQDTGMLWLNNKTVYRKLIPVTFPQTSAAGNMFTVTHNIGVIPNLIDAGICHAPGGYNGLYRNFNLDNATDTTVDFTFGSELEDWGDQYLILEYTKP